MCKKVFLPLLYVEFNGESLKFTESRYVFSVHVGVICIHMVDFWMPSHIYVIVKTKIDDVIMHFFCEV